MVNFSHAYYQRLGVYSLLGVRQAYDRNQSYDFCTTLEVIHKTRCTYAVRKFGRKSTTCTDMSYDILKFDLTERILAVFSNFNTFFCLFHNINTEVAFLRHYLRHCCIFSRYVTKRNVNLMQLHII